MSLRTLLLVYVFGGLTFLPLVFLLVLGFSYLTLPRVPQDHANDEPGTRLTHHSKDSSEDDGFADKEGFEGGGNNAAAGYFAVCREYVPGGINGKPPERSTPAGEVLSSESPSVYQSMYRSIFERGKTPSHSIEGDKKDAKAVKRPRNVFFVVLRHEHLLLFDNSDQLEVRHVISLLHHNIDIFGGEDELVEGDLWIKKNCIRLTRRYVVGQPGVTSQPFYIFSDNCSEKEDFYHAMLVAQSAVREDEPGLSPRPKLFETDHIIKLVKALHTLDSDSHCRWFNALLGRVFLALYRTEDIKDAVKAKIDRKIARVPKPNFISSIQVQSVDMGDSAPVFSNFKLKELMVDGGTTIEADVKYTGSFRLQIAAVARIELGSRIRPREVDLVLAGILRKLSGHILVRIKPPPSNRLWVTFESISQMDLTVEPVVSSMQITYGFILRAIENRIREVVSETLVLPNWDDLPFFDTEAYDCRGGIWEAANKKDLSSRRGTMSEIATADTAMEGSPNLRTITTSGTEEADKIPPLSPKTISMPNLLSSPTKESHIRKGVRKSVLLAEPETDMTSISVPAHDDSGSVTPSRSKPTSPSFTPADREREKPKVMRSHSFAAASAAIPQLSTDDVNATPSAQIASRRKPRGRKDAVDLVKDVKARDDAMSTHRPSPSELTEKSSLEGDSDEGSKSRSTPVPDSQIHEGRDENIVAPKPNLAATFPLPDARGHRKSWNLSMLPPSGTALERATSAAKNWGMGMINRPSNRGPSISGFTSLAKEAGLEESSEARHSVDPAPSEKEGQKGEPGDAAVANDPSGHVASADKKDKAATSEHSRSNTVVKDASVASAKDKGPFGRGQPLPPPGAPLPGPRQSLWTGSTFSLSGNLKRKSPPQGQAPTGSSNIITEDVDAKQEVLPSTFHAAMSDLKAGEDATITQHHRRASGTSGNAATPAAMDDDKDRPNHSHGPRGSHAREKTPRAEAENQDMAPIADSPGEVHESGKDVVARNATTKSGDVKHEGPEVADSADDKPSPTSSEGAPPLPARPVPDARTRHSTKTKADNREVNAESESHVDAAPPSAIVEDGKTSVGAQANRDKVKVQTSRPVGNAGGSMKGQGGWFLGGTAGSGRPRPAPASQGDVKRRGKEKDE